MRILNTLDELKKFRSELKSDLGFVPTMGALHGGHLSLIERSRMENPFSVVSIFINPTQFNNPEDLQNYPSPLEKDLELLKNLGVDAVFTPKKDDLYPDDYRFRVSEVTDSQVLCGAHRPGHFDGVLTVVLKLLNLVRPTHAYFGEKDYQQLRLIEGMVQALFLPIKIVACPTLREEDGLAMSSRNLLLSKDSRSLAPKFSALLKGAKDLCKAQEQLSALGFEVDYLEERWGRRFGAVTLEGVRLIDNVPV